MSRGYEIGAIAIVGGIFFGTLGDGGSPHLTFRGFKIRPIAEDVLLNW
jgi:hypothetical protein